jgi:hypothetical protein
MDKTELIRLARLGAEARPAGPSERDSSDSSAVPRFGLHCQGECCNTYQVQCATAQANVSSAT